LHFSGKQVVLAGEQVTAPGERAGRPASARLGRQARGLAGKRGARSASAAPGWQTPDLVNKRPARRASVARRDGTGAVAVLDRPGLARPRSPGSMPRPQD
jgi:hypothetical protein